MANWCAPCGPGYAPRVTPLWLLSAPPFGPALWDGARARLAERFAVRSLDLVDSAEDFSLPAVWTRLQARLGEEAPGLLVGHGLAVPYLLAFASSLPLRGLVLCNGPIGPLHPLLAAASALARQGAVLDPLLRPGLAIPALASSLGLRRAVRNPYVMDRDTVVAVCGPALSGARPRRALRVLLAGLPEPTRSTAPVTSPLLLIWGDEDRLHPASCVDLARLRAPGLRHHRVAGGRLLHPVERPWETAEAIERWESRLEA